MRKVEKYYVFKRDCNPNCYLSESVLKDLNLSDVFDRINATVSKVGGQFLFAALCKDETSVFSISYSKILKHFDQNGLNLNKYTEKSLTKLAKDSASQIVSLFTEQLTSIPKSQLFFVSIIRFLPAIFLLLFFIWKWSLCILIILLLLHTLIHFLSKRDQLVTEEAIAQLPTLLNVAKKLHKRSEFSALFPHLDQDFQKIAKIRIPTFFKVDKVLQNDIFIIAWWGLEIVKIFFLSEVYIFYKSTQAINKEQQAIENIYNFVGSIDLLLSIHKIKQKENVCTPLIQSKSQIIFQRLVHPLLPSCVPNSILIEDKSVFLLGSNMSGKSTFLRTIGVNMLLGKNLNFCFASSFKVRKWMKINTLIHTNDDLLENESFFYKEVLGVKKMLNVASQKNRLFLIDEIFKGTNTNERISAAKAVLRFLHNRGNIVFVSTHETKLAELLTDEFAIYHFCESDEKENDNFDYQLKKGMLKATNALRLLERNDYGTEIMEEAYATLKKL